MTFSADGLQVPHVCRIRSSESPAGEKAVLSDTVQTTMWRRHRGCFEEALGGTDSNTTFSSDQLDGVTIGVARLAVPMRAKSCSSGVRDRGLRARTPVHSRIDGLGSGSSVDNRK